MENEKATQPLFEWYPPPAYLKWRLSRPAFIAMLVEFALGIVGGAVLYVALQSVMLALGFLLFAVTLGLLARWLIPRINAGAFRALGESLETRAASKHQYVSYRHLSLCTVEHESYEGVRFALLRFRMTAEYQKVRKWYQPRALKPVPVGEGEELERVLHILRQKGVDVVYVRRAGE
jgi:hypothetical protein